MAIDNHTASIGRIRKAATFAAGMRLNTVILTSTTGLAVRSIRLLGQSFGACLGLLLALGAYGQNLIISEYVEGSGNNKYIELYNGSAANIDLSFYQLHLFNNGSGTVSTIGTPAMTGILPPGGTIVYRHNLATIYGGPSVVNSAVNFNGDDAIALYRTAAPSGLIDIIGNIGCDPGSAWASGSHSTLDRSLVRKYNICTGISTDPAHTGNTVAGCPFPTLESQWDVNGVDVVSNLGSHYMDCSPVVNFQTATSSPGEGSGSATVTLTMQGSVPAGSITINIANGPGCAYTTDYTTTPGGGSGDITISYGANPGTISFTVAIVDDVLDEGNETITFTIAAATGGVVLGTVLSHTMTIIDNDGPPTYYFSTTNITVLEDPGSVQTFTIGISPAAVGTGTVTIGVTAGVGAVCGPAIAPWNSDFQISSPVVNCAASSFTLSYGPGATSLTFNVTVHGDNGAGGYHIESTEQVSFTITGVTGTAAIGANNSGVLNIADDDSPPTVLSAGDLVIVGLNTNNGACSGNSTEDLVSFFCFKQINTGTKLILTDNGYSRCYPGQWGNNEGTVEMTRTGPTIPAGQVITFRIRGQFGPSNVAGIAPDANWTCASLNGNRALDMSSSGDQIFFMQGGVWNPGTGTDHNATYTGTVLYGFSTTSVWSTPPFSSCTNSANNSLSGLPVSMPCFSMAPTTSQIFNKYVGPLTAASQRDWIIRMDNTGNWAPYLSCNAFNSATPNWLLAPILPITSSTFTPGLWRGGASTPAGTDWFDCKNWDDATVPTATTIVRIDETAYNHCVVGAVTAGGNASCAALVQTNSGAAVNLTVQNSSSLAVGGPIVVQRSSSGAPVTLTVLGNSTLTATNFTVQGTAANEAVFRNEVAGNTISFSGDLTIGAGGLIDLQGAGVGGNIFLAGNYTNLGPTEATLDETYGSLRFNGSGPQSITTNGFQEVFNNFIVDKSGGSAITLNNPVALRGVLNLMNGNVNTGAALLTMRAGSSTIGASDNSYVNGPMVKVGNTNFTFPVGKAGDYRPCSVSGIVGSTTDAFRAEYFPISAATWGTTGDPTLHHISTCEYWTIDRSVGTPEAVVSLTWEAPASCGVSNPADLRVARWDDTATPAPGTWRDRGNGGASGSPSSGTIPTAATQNLFNATTTAWTLASVSVANPLPITLLWFDARPEGNIVRLEWATATEHQNALFTVERSKDGISFEPVVEVPGAMNSSVRLDYEAVDPSPYPGLSYYRLRQTDVDGTTTASNIVAVLFGGLSERPLVIYGNGESWTAIHSFPAGSTYELMDMTGRRILSGSTGMEGRTDFYGVMLSRGAYLFRIVDGDRQESQRFVY